MKRVVLFFLCVVGLSCGDAAFGQSVPEISYDSAPNLLKMPNDIYLGEVLGVSTNSKGHIFRLHAHRLGESDHGHKPGICTFRFAPF